MVFYHIVTDESIRNINVLKYLVFHNLVTRIMVKIRIKQTVSCPFSDVFETYLNVFVCTKQQRVLRTVSLDPSLSPGETGWSGNLV